MTDQGATNHDEGWSQSLPIRDNHPDVLGSSSQGRPRHIPGDINSEDFADIRDPMPFGEMDPVELSNDFTDAESPGYSAENLPGNLIALNSKFPNRMAGVWRSPDSISSIYHTPMSNINNFSPAMFYTPHSVVDRLDTIGEGDKVPSLDHRAARASSNEPQKSAWNQYLHGRGLIPEPFDEMDWSGRGQHAEFNAGEESSISLTLEKVLGHSATALVESVRCRRIRLARKTVQVSRRLKREEVINEVELLQRLQHTHIIRVVGTYTLPRRLCILLYPVAEYTLNQFLVSLGENPQPQDHQIRLFSISNFIGCLARALLYIHDKAIKHMDIKPKNLLVRDLRRSRINNEGHYKIYIADFGIVRSYASIVDSNTESLTAFTRTYAAPEVVAQENRNQKADIFSLGCVYTEMLAVLAEEPAPLTNLETLRRIREENTNDTSYQANTEEIMQWLKTLVIRTYGFESGLLHWLAWDRLNWQPEDLSALTANMLNPNPALRPGAFSIIRALPFFTACCESNYGTEPQSEPFEAADIEERDILAKRYMPVGSLSENRDVCQVPGCGKIAVATNIAIATNMQIVHATVSVISEFYGAAAESCRELGYRLPF